MTQTPPIRESPDAERPAGRCALNEMIYACFDQVAHLSEASTLEPGDVIATGTPARVALRQPFPEGVRKVGDIMRIEVEGIGALTNTVVEGSEGYLVPDAGWEAAWVH